jgi:hypothetical protein
MLRRVALGLGLALLAGGVVALIAGSYSIALPCLAGGAIVVLVILCERVVYKRVGNRPPPGPGWQRTSERFIDDSTGRTVTVYVKPRTGERAYVAEPGTDAVKTS